MSKYVKNLIADHLHCRLENIQDALLVNVIGLKANANTRLRALLRSKNIHLMVVKNSMAARATADTPLAKLFTDLNGTAAVCWGSEDIVALTKEVIQLTKDEQFAPFTVRAGVIDGERFSAEQVEQVSKWPSRREQLSILVGRILAPAMTLAAQLNSVGGRLASQIAERAKRAEETPDQA